jgi:hypothetical protein
MTTIPTTGFPGFREIRWSDPTTPQWIFGSLAASGDRIKLELMAESFNLFNRDNQRVQITQDGFITNSAQFVQTTNTTGINIFPAEYRVPSTFLRATDAYAPRQVQLAWKLIY